MPVPIRNAMTNFNPNSTGRNQTTKAEPATVFSPFRLQQFGPNQNQNYFQRPNNSTANLHFSPLRSSKVPDLMNGSNSIENRNKQQLDTIMMTSNNNDENLCGKWGRLMIGGNGCSRSPGSGSLRGGGGGDTPTTCPDYYHESLLKTNMTHTQNKIRRRPAPKTTNPGALTSR